jgi:isopenicillin N synthase-like dioxygenase
MTTLIDRTLSALKIFMGKLFKVNPIQKVSKRLLTPCFLTALPLCHAGAMENKEANPIEFLSLDVISYDDFIKGDSEAVLILEQALYEKGIVGIKGVPGYKEKVQKLITAAREFSALPEADKEACAPDRSIGDMFNGYEKGKEKFKISDDSWVVDELKASYYADIPDRPSNKWPSEIDLRTPFLELGTLMANMGEAVMKKIGLIGADTNIFLDETCYRGRMLYYRKSIEGATENPFWCGAHCDNGLFTTLIPGLYFSNGTTIDEPQEAGLFVRTTKEGPFQKVAADDHDIMMFQVGEFGQLVANDAIRATQHRVHKASGCIERYAMAVFFNAPMDTVIHSYSELAEDTRYGSSPGEPCSYRRWHQKSFERYLVKD